MKPLRKPKGAFARELPETPARLRDAAMRILARDGFSGVTINSVAEEAGEYRTSIAYYFGGKQGLLEAVAEAVNPYEEVVEGIARCDEIAPGPERVAAQVGALREMTEDKEAYLAFFELLPHVLRDEGLRTNLSDLYEWYREVDVRMFGVNSSGPEDLWYAGAIVAAVCDGLALQASLDPDRIDLKKAFAMLERALNAVLPSLSVDWPSPPEEPTPAGSNRGGL
jgi:AcrR family transcriptional regulator